MTLRSLLSYFRDSKHTHRHTQIKHDIAVKWQTHDQFLNYVVIATCVLLWCAESKKWTLDLPWWAYSISLTVHSPPFVDHCFRSSLLILILYNLLTLRWRPYFMFHQRHRSNYKRLFASLSHNTYSFFFFFGHILFSFLLVDIKFHAFSWGHPPLASPLPMQGPHSRNPCPLLYFCSLSPASFSSAHRYSGPSPILILLPHPVATSFLSFLPQALFCWTFSHLIFKNYCHGEQGKSQFISTKDS